MSWAEDVNAHRQQKVAAPPLPNIKRFVRSDGAGRRHEERQYNIVTNNISDPSVARSLETKEVDQATSHVNRAVQKHLAGAYHGYNIVTMEPVYGISEESCSAMGGNQEPRGKKMHERLRGENVIALGSLPPKPDDLPKQKRVRGQRQTDILSHRYLKDHDVRQAEEKAKQREKVEAVAANTCEFNPLTGKFYNSAQESLRQAEENFVERKRREEVADHTYKTSGIVERSEGHAFDIVTNTVYNKDKVLKLEQGTMKGIPQRAALRLKWEHQRDVEEAIQEADVRRALHRMSTERADEVRRRGFNALTNEPLAATTGRIPAKKSAEKPVLQRLHESTELKSYDTSDVLQANGPRTTTERLFQVPASSVASHVSTFKGRQELLVPSLKRALGQPLSGFSS